MGLFEYILKKLAKFQKKFPLGILIATILFTAFLGYGITMVEFQGDMSKEMPQDLPIFVLNNKITDTFGGQDTIFVLLMIDNSLQEKPLYDDVREPEIMQYMVKLEESLIHESSVDEVLSFAPMIRFMEENDIPITHENIKNFISQNPQSSALINEDYTIAMMLIKADVGTGEEKVRSLTELIENKVAALSVPSGVEVMVTGSPSIIVAVLELLRKDAMFTIVLASSIIFLLLLIMQRSFMKSLLIFFPLLLGLVWTLGTMGWIGLKISVATAGLGAMVLGLGVEYGVFILTRYYEEREKKKNQLDSIIVSVPAVGSAILGSGMTTIVGFLALTLSVMPMLQNLGLSLAIGIFFSILAAVFVEPALIILEENLEYWFSQRSHRRLKKKIAKHKVMPR